MKPASVFEKLKEFSPSSTQYLTGRGLSLAIGMVILGAVLWSAVIEREIPDLYFVLASIFLSVIGTVTNFFVIVYKEIPTRNATIRGWLAQFFGVMGIFFWICVGYLGLQAVLDRFM